MMPVYVVIPTTARIRKDTHLFLKVKLDQYSARSKFLLIINGTRAIARQNWSSYQYWGCSMTLWMGTKHKKLPANKAKIGPLRIEKWCNTEDSISLPKCRKMNFVQKTNLLNWLFTYFWIWSRLVLIFTISILIFIFLDLNDTMWMDFIVFSHLFHPQIEKRLARVKQVMKSEILWSKMSIALPKDKRLFNFSMISCEIAEITWIWCQQDIQRKWNVFLWNAENCFQVWIFCEHGFSHSVWIFFKN